MIWLIGTTQRLTIQPYTMDNRREYRAPHYEFNNPVFHGGQAFGR
jgi:hypothetical protein